MTAQPTKRRRGLTACDCPLGDQGCPICRARAIETLLVMGKPDMALRLARGLDRDIVEHLGRAAARAHDNVVRQVRERMAAQAAAEPAKHPKAQAATRQPRP